MQYEAVCEQVRDNIADLLLHLGPSRAGAAYAAACATRNVAAALHHAAGSPENHRWRQAIESLEHFLDLCSRSPRVEGSAALAALRGFVEENADLLPSRLQLRRAS
jgi:hypothetical protein